MPRAAHLFLAVSARPSSARGPTGICFRKEETRELLGGAEQESSSRDPGYAMLVDQWFLLV